MRKIALLGDGSSHGGTLITTNQSGSVTVGGTPVCVEGCLHQCPLPNHGTTAVTPVTIETYIDGKLVITEGAIAGCGAVITPPDRGVYVE